MKIKMENLNEFYIKKLEQQVEQLQAELAAVNSEKEHKLPEWNDKEAEWQSIYPPGATIVMPLPPADGKVTIVKEKFYPADKELIDKHQADKEQLREWANKSACVMASFISASALPDSTAWGEIAVEAARLLNTSIASTDSSNWLAEQKAQWRREVLEEAANNMVSNPAESWPSAAEELRRMAKEQ